jgi:tol-pal system protein YbgF
LDPEEIYAQAYNIYKEGRLTEAREAFTGFLRQFPNTEYSDNAQFWIGECHFKENNYEEAILAYEDVVAKYPAGNKVPDALLKQGLCFQELGDMVSSRIILQRIVENHPDSPQAEIAKSRLEKSN